MGSIYSFRCSVLCIIVCTFDLFLLVIVLVVLRFTASDYPFWYLQIFLILRDTAVFVCTI